MRRVVIASLVATVTAWAATAHAVPAVTGALPNTTAAHCESTGQASGGTAWCAGANQFGALDGRLPEKGDAFGVKPGTFAALMQNIGLDADEVVYPQSNRASSLTLGTPVQATAKKAAILPEPATWVMLLLGFGAIGAFVRRRFRKSEERFNARIRSITAGEGR